MDLYFLENWHVLRALMIVLMLVLFGALVAVVRVWQHGKDLPQSTRTGATDTRLERLGA